MVNGTAKIINDDLRQGGAGPHDMSIPSGIEKTKRHSWMSRHFRRLRGLNSMTLSASEPGLTAAIFLPEKAIRLGPSNYHPTIRDIITVRSGSRCDRLDGAAPDMPDWRLSSRSTAGSFQLDVPIPTRVTAVRRLDDSAGWATP